MGNFSRGESDLFRSPITYPLRIICSPITYLYVPRSIQAPTGFLKHLKR